MTIAHSILSPDSPAARRALAAIQAEVDRIRPAGAAVVPRPFRTAEERDSYLGFCATMAAEWVVKATRAAGSAVRPPADRPGIPAATPPPPDPGDPASGVAGADESRPAELIELRARFANLADLYRTAVAERDEARAEVERSHVAIDGLIDELADVTEG